MDFSEVKEFDIKKEETENIEAFAEGKGLGERVLGTKDDEFNDVIDKVFVVNVVVEAIEFLNQLLASPFFKPFRGQGIPLRTPIQVGSKNFWVLCL